MPKKEVVAMNPVSINQKKEYQSLCRQISTSMKSLETNYIKLAVALANVDAGQFYEIDGFKNITDFAKERYNISKSTCYDYISLVKVFCLTDDSKPVYTSKQMVAMLPYVRNGGSVEEFNPDMSVRDIKKHVKELVVSAVSDGASDFAPIKASKPKKSVFLSLSCMEDYLAQSDMIKALIENALSNGHQVQLVSLN